MTLFVVLNASETPQEALDQLLESLPYAHPDPRYSLDQSLILLSYEDTMPELLTAYYDGLGRTPAPLSLAEAQALVVTSAWQIPANAMGTRAAILSKVTTNKPIRLVLILLGIAAVAAIVAKLAF